MTENYLAIALVTGATEGIGKETVRQLASAGVRVILGARNLAKGFIVLEELRRIGLELDLIEIDICCAESVDRAAKELESRYGHLDILINNAGICLDKESLSTMPMEDFIATYETNLFGTIRVTQHLLPLIRQSTRGRIVNVSSSLASFAGMTDESSPYYNIHLPAYASSKAALNVFTIQLARELKHLGIKVNAVDPGLTATRYVSVPGAQPIEVGAQASVRYALIGEDGPTGQFFDRHGTCKW